MNKSLCAWVSTVSMAVVGHAQAALVFSETEFNLADWSLTPFPYGVNGGNGGAEQTALGNPGPGRRVANTYGGSFSGSYNSSIYELFSYNPALGGPLTDLSFTIQSRYEDALNALGFTVRQGPYTWGVGYFLNSSVWDTYAITPTSADFFTNPFNLASAGQPALPDFSAAGLPIFFGFYTGNGSAGASFGETRYGLFDNFSVSFVPAPASAVMLGTAALVLTRRRR